MKYFDLYSFALELYHASDSNISDSEVHSAIEPVPSKLREILLQVLARKPGISRVDNILYARDPRTCSWTLPQHA